MKLRMFSCGAKLWLQIVGGVRARAHYSLMSALRRVLLSRSCRDAGEHMAGGRYSAWLLLLDNDHLRPKWSEISWRELPKVSIGMDYFI